MKNVLQKTYQIFFKKGVKTNKSWLKSLAKAKQAKKMAYQKQKATQSVLIDTVANFGDDLAKVKQGKPVPQKVLKYVNKKFKREGISFTKDQAKNVAEGAKHLQKYNSGSSQIIYNIKQHSDNFALQKIQGIGKEFAHKGGLTKKGKRYFYEMGFDESHIQRLSNKVKSGKLNTRLFKQEISQHKQMQEMNKQLSEQILEIGSHDSLYTPVRKMGKTDLLDDLYNAVRNPVSTKKKRQALQRGYDAIKSGRAEMGMKEPKQGALERLFGKHLTTLNTKTDKAMQLALESGNLNTALQIQSFSSTMTNAAAIGGLSRGQLLNLKPSLQKLSSKQDMAFKAYTQHRGRDGRKLFTVSHKGRKLDVDLELKAALRGQNTFKTPHGKTQPVSKKLMQQLQGPDGKSFYKLHGEYLDDDIIRLSNKYTNVQRRLMKSQKDLASGRTQNALENLSVDPKKIPDSYIEFRGKRFSTDTIGDLGENYIPYVPREAVKESMRKNKILDPNVFGALDGTSTLSKARKATRHFEQKPWLTKRMDDSIGLYAHKYGKAVEQGAPIEALNRAEASFALTDQFIGSTTAAKGATMQGARNQTKAFQDIRQHMQSIFEKNRDAGAGETLLSHFTDPITNLSKSYALVNRSLAMSSPKLALLNRFQPFNMRFTNESIPRSFLDNLAGVGKSDMKAVKTLFRKGNMKQVVKELSSQKNMTPIERYTVQKYFDTYMSDMTSAVIHLGENKTLRKLSDVITLPFTSGDIAARYSVAKSSVKSIQKAVKKYPGNPKKIMKEAAIDVLDYQDQNAVMTALKKANFSTVTKEAASSYTNAMINKKLFNYGKFGKPAIIDKARQNPLLALTVTLSTWPMYWGNTMRTVARAYGQGNKQPAKKLLATAATWFGGMAGGYSMLKDEDGKFAEYMRDFTSYGVNRTPIFSPVSGALNLLNRPVSGIGADQVGMLNYMINYAAGETQKKLYGDDETSLQMMIDMSKREMNKSPWRTRSKEIMELWEELQ